MCEYPLAVVTDLDASAISSVDYSYDGVPEAARSLWGLGIPVVAATSKTLWELAIWWRRLGFHGPCGGVLGVVELGGALVGSEDLLPQRDWVDPSTGLAVVELAPRLEGLRNLLERIIPAACRDRVTIIRGAPEEEVSEALGLRGEEASAASRRLWDEAIWSSDRACLEAIALRALRAGLNVVEGARVLHVTGAPGKRGALEALERLAPWLLGARWVAIGDSPADRDMLEWSWAAVVIPHPPGRVAVRPRRGDYVVAPEPAPGGWVWAASTIELIYSTPSSRGVGVLGRLTRRPPS